ncbi:MAG: teichuronic acid biosynthesis glycosyltransferase TuaC [Myxococcales bacterium]|nr:teichuronic acid biosynthesis glycosyltransferase TuaC [Myxococcales bacterium]
MSGHVPEGTFADMTPGGRRLRVLIITKIFPNAEEPLSAPFNRQQFVALSRLCDVEVLATIPWFPAAGLFGRWSSTGRLAAVPAREIIEGVAVAHPRFFYVPRVGQLFMGAFYAASVLPAVLRRRGHFDVILGSWAYPDGVAALALALMVGVPAVVKLHGSDIDVLSTRFGPRQNMRLALPRADRVVAVSRALAEKVIALGVPREKVDVVTNGVDRELFRPQDRAAARQALGYGADQRRWLLFVGRVEEAKGALDLCRAFASSAAAADGRATLVMVGGGKGLAACQDITRELGDRVLFVGSRSHDEVARWMGACDTLVLPSHHEGTPNVVLEALACGRRAIGTNVGGIPDVINAPALGELVPVGDVPALAAALDRAVASDYDPQAVAALGGRRGWDDSAARLQAVLARAVRDRGPSSRETFASAA